MPQKSYAAGGGGGGGSGTYNHSALNNLDADDHTQYHNDTRGDARYSQLGHAHVELELFSFFLGG